MLVLRSTVLLVASLIATLAAMPAAAQQMKATVGFVSNADTQPLRIGRELDMLRQQLDSGKLLWK